MKYKIFAALSIIVPIALFIFIISKKASLEKNLVLNKGILVESKKISRGARSAVVYKHKVKGYDNYLEGTYTGIAGLFINNKIKEIYENPPAETISKDIYWLNPILKSELDRKAYFYTVFNEQKSTNSSSYIYLRLESEPFSKLSYNVEVMQYVLHKQIGRLILFFIMIFNLLLFIGAFIRYQNNKTYIVTFFIVLIYHLILVFY
ncbi:hypothetical protein [Pedobacter roseus]|uniref:Uncharacterized protein n=1 Tax=Pedobacter roseus TaxID=336820 RepID=A0A7G9QBD1_9SPHI|nr:hypothetical protein [Pedobacter roseus]QNN40656.1 hypothetical protein H9L23_16115 [Pedobacter roseus]